MAITVINEYGETEPLTYENYEQYCASQFGHKDIIQALAAFAKTIRLLYPSETFTREMLNLACDLYRDRYYDAGDDLAPLRICANYALVFIYREIERTGTFRLEAPYGSSSN
jgi:hypothetical protein